MMALTNVLAAVARDVVAERDELNRLDGVAGDGDMGITMTTAANALLAIFPEIARQDLATALKRCGSELARKAPSTSGTLVATAFLRAGRAAGDATSSPVDQLAHLVEAALRGIEERGKSAPGDKTMLDALAPAATALRAAADDGTSLHAALTQAASAAADGAHATATMRARVGRAGWLADRSEGNVDAGAYLVAVVFASAARHPVG
jgi:dihydroxyacetone kinase